LYAAKVSGHESPGDADAVPSPKQRTANVRETRPCGPGLLEIRFDTAGEPPLYQAGQWLAFKVTAGADDDEKLWQRASLSSAPHEAVTGGPAGSFAVLAATDQEDPGGARLEALSPGDSLPYHGPHGDFTLRPEPPRAAVFIADGVGVGPVRGLLATLFREGGPPCAVRLIHQAPVTLGLAYRGEFEALDTREDGFQYVPTVPGADSDWHGETREIIELVPDLFEATTEIAQHHWYIAGPAATAGPLEAWLRSNGVGTGSVRVHRFAR
jgi:ferredoxin-NADP reductase